MEPRQAYPGQECLNTTRFPAIARHCWRIGLLSPRQWVVAPLPRDEIPSDNQSLVDHESPADTRTEDHAEDNPSIGRSSVLGFRKSQTIGVILNPYPFPQPAGEILLKWLPVQDHSIRVPEKTRRRRPGTRCCDANVLHEAHTLLRIGYEYRYGI